MIIIDKCSIINKINQKNFYLIKNISLKINSFEKVGIIGENGSGKSTLLNLIHGNLKPDIGKIQSQEKSHMFDYGYNFSHSLTGRENVYYSLIIRNISKKEIDQNIDYIEKEMDVGFFFDEPLHKYSHGMVARLKFLVEMQIKSKVYLIDEALSGADRKFRIKAANILRNRLEKATIILVSHNPLDILNFTNRFIHIHKGEIIEDTKNEKYVINYFNND